MAKIPSVPEVLNGEPPDGRFDYIVQQEHNADILADLAPLTRLAVAEAYGRLRNLSLFEGEIALRGGSEASALLSLN